MAYCSTIIGALVCISCIDHAIAAYHLLIHHADSPTPFLGIVADYSEDTWILSETDDELSELNTTLIQHPTDSFGCTDWPPTEKQDSIIPTSLHIGLINRGGCTFLDKTIAAQRAGFDALFVVSDDHSMSRMTAEEAELKQFRSEVDHVMLTLMVPASFQAIMDETRAQINVRLQNYVEKPQRWDYAMLIMIATATALVGIGAYYASDAERAAMTGQHSKRRKQMPVQDISPAMAWSFVVLASCGLLTLYFFVSKIFIVMVVLFCISATNGLAAVFGHAVDRVMPHLQTKQYEWSRIDLFFTMSDVVAYIPASLLSITWYMLRREPFAWLLQDVMCFGLLLLMQRTIRLTNLKIASILLCSAFLYDIFWVFLSPMFFESSVMVAVATYKHEGVAADTLPVVLKFPKFEVGFMQSSSMILGLGDIALPGMLVSYLLRFDYVNRIGVSLRKGYFVPALIGYAIGMVMTDISMILMQKGQPALLYLVPTTLGTTVFLAYSRGQLGKMWNGSANKYSSVKTQKPES